MNSWTFNNNYILFFFILLLTFTTCQKTPSRTDVDPEYVTAVQEWHSNRIKALTAPDSWLSLAGLFWLKQGENRFGSHRSNDFVFPNDKAPEFMGLFFLEDDRVRVKINKGVNVTAKDTPVTEMPLQSDETGDPPILSWGTLSWYIIKRGDKYGVRLRDSEHPRLKEFKGIKTYPIDPEWRVTARFEPYDPPRQINVPNVLGTISEEPSPGALVFDIKGKTYRLDPVAEPGAKRYFIIFADETSGRETYDAGRFLYIDAPGEDGTTIIDFNKAYNPPCAFSPFATCPLPPSQNRLAVKITAGEKNYESGH
ncbi:DUF1684 domain-containing protein [candidate division KSB1 bacterium]|nr:DUF1684 domain-containing protein [candidate division KSB1 bacterium]